MMQVQYHSTIQCSITYAQSYDTLAQLMKECNDLVKNNMHRLFFYGLQNSKFYILL